MGNNKDNVTTGKPKVGGAAYFAPKGSAIPTDAVTALATAYKSLGYCSEDGLKNNGSRTVETVKAWGGDVVLTPQSGKVDEYKITLIESLNKDVLMAANGDENVTGTLESGMTVIANAKELGEHIWIFEMILKGGILERIVIPAGVVTNVEEVSYDDKNAVGYALTITALPDASGNTSYKHFKNPGVPGITLDRQTAEIVDGDTLTLNAAVYPADATVTWATSSSSVATVTDGVVTAVDSGIVKITASITQGGTTYKAECYITVTSAT